ncbi:MAG: sel1 repeat family protein [Gammaproteobacteria bacterium]|nr:sel1 repeat family protein [Gammaproteobacteria bacterium]
MHLKRLLQRIEQIFRWNITAFFLIVSASQASNSDVFAIALALAQQGNPQAQYEVSEHYKNGAYGAPLDEIESIRWLKESARSGYPDALYFLAYRYDVGLGLDINKPQAIALYTQASEKDHPKATYYLAWSYDVGDGVPSDDVKAVALYRKAAGLGYRDAQYTLGQMLRDGEGVERNVQEAIYWYGKAAEQGDYDALTWIAEIYDNGRDYDLPEDNIKANDLYHRAAKEGSTRAFYEIGLNYYQGDGVKQDLLEALRWLNIAKNRDFDRAQERIDEIEKALATQ